MDNRSKGKGKGKGGKDAGGKGGGKGYDSYAGDYQQPYGQMPYQQMPYMPYQGDPSMMQPVRTVYTSSEKRKKRINDQVCMCCSLFVKFVITDVRCCTLWSPERVFTGPADGRLGHPRPRGSIPLWRPWGSSGVGNFLRWPGHSVLFLSSHNFCRNCYQNAWFLSKLKYIFSLAFLNHLANDYGLTGTTITPGQAVRSGNARLNFRGPPVKVTLTLTLTSQNYLTLNWIFRKFRRIIQS